MEEERARQEEAQKRAEEETKVQPEQSHSAESAPIVEEVEMVEVGDEEEEQLRQAIALSVQKGKITNNVQMLEDDEEEMQLAMQMSLGTAQVACGNEFNPFQPASTESEEDNKNLMEDPNFVSSILMSLPGVDPDDERIKVIFSLFLNFQECFETT